MITVMRSTCSECGAEVPLDAPGGLCPACLFQLEEPTVGDPSSKPESSPAVVGFGTRRFADYELLEEIARGGMGIVYKARQLSLDRIVALKMILFGSMASAEQVRRFRIEASAAGSLQHPNIVTVHEVGLHEGQHFLVMDYVDGPNLAHLVQERPLPARQAATYLKSIAEAVQFAHDRGILHRDLKPSNVLLGSDDRPRVTDFGVAKRFDSESSLTLTGHVLGSPNYMPPEQAGGGQNKVGRTSDVYSLGAILYHLLTARPPFRAETLAETLQQVQQSDPISPRLLNPSVPRDLETICLKCLEKEPARRYKTAQDLADELGRFLNQEPILARPISRRERAWRWCRRKPLVANLAAATAVLLLAVLIGAPIAAYRINRERENLRLNLYAADMKLAYQAWQDGVVDEAKRLLERHRPAAGQKELRGFEWQCLWRLVRESDAGVTLKGCPSLFSEFRQVGDVLYHTSGSECKAWRMGTWDEVQIKPNQGTRKWQWDVSTLTAWEVDQEKRVLTVHDLPSLSKRAQIPFSGAFYSAAMAPNRQTFALVFSEAQKYRILIWDLLREQMVGTLGEYPCAFHMEFSPDGRTLLVAREDGQDFQLWDILHLKQLPGPIGEQYHVDYARFTPDGKSVILWEGMWSPVLWVWDWRSERAPVRLEHPGIPNRLEISSDGAWLATAAWDGTVMIWDLRTRRLFWNFRAHLDRILGLRFSADNRLLATTGSDRIVRVWEIESQKNLAVLRGPMEEVWSIQFANDQKSLFTASHDGTVKVWDIAVAGTLNQFSGPRSLVANMAIWPDGSRIASAGNQGVRLWDTTSRIEIERDDTRSGSGIPARVFDVAISPDSRFLASVSDAGLTILDLQTGQTETLPAERHGEALPPVLFSANGRETSFGHDAQVMICDLTTRKLQPFAACKGTVTGLAYSPDGARLFSGDQTGWVTLWDRQSGRRLSEKLAHYLVKDVKLSPDGRVLATCGFDGFLKLWLWEGDTLRLMHTAPRQPSALLNLVFSPDGSRLFSANRNGTITVWGLHPFLELGAFLHPGGTRSLAISPDGKTLYSGGWEGIIRAWPTDSLAKADGLEESPARGHSGRRGQDRQTEKGEP